MENRNIIIILVAVVIVLAVVAGAMFLQSGNAKEPTKIKITSDKEQYEGGKLKVQLTDLNKTALSKQKVNVIVKNKKGKVVVNETVKTNSKGKANLDLDLKKGNYQVKVIYKGNENYTGNNTTQKLKIKEEVKEEASTTSSSSSNSYVDRILNDPSCTVVKDPYDICPIHGVPYWQDNYCDWFINPL
ncbi:hypothetical protein [Methanobrevibacter sp.]|uniref:hypothetical protein n=1 Tax=Methanobrevibacter sp. TaxID=66852 RepID=UPI003865591E